MRVIAWLLLLVVAIAIATYLAKRPAWREGFARSRSGSNATDRQIFAEYAGSSSCQSCHTAEYASWKGSHHGLAERPLAASDSQAFVPSRTVHHGTQRTEVSLANARPQLTTMGPGARIAPFTIERVIGVDPLRQFLVRFPDGRDQTLEVSYDPARDDWFDVYGSEDRRPGEWGHWTGRGMNWNGMCASCHNTRLRKHYDEHADRYATTMVEPGVGCESCHGPMKSHVAWQGKHPKAGVDDPTVHATSRDAMMETCAPCHSRRVELSGDFVPGESFHDHYSLTVPDESNTYYPDGQVRDEDYEYAAFLGSRMQAAGVRCVDCHEPHTARTRLPGNLLCMRCHDGTTRGAPRIAPAEHGHHTLDPAYVVAAGPDTAALAHRAVDAVNRSGGECVNCHMPQTIYMQRHRRHDHGFTIPDPLLTKQTGTPNACNRCHTDKNADWAVSWTSKWYGVRMDRPSHHRALTIAAARRGDETARDALVMMLTGGEAPYWQAVAANLLGRWVAVPGVTSALVGATRSPSALVRAQAGRSLGTLAEADSSDAIRALRPLLDDPARSVRFHTAWALRASLDSLSRAGRDLAQTLAIASDQPQGQMQMGAYALARGRAPDALEHYRKAVEWDSLSAPERHELAIVLSELGRIQEAVEQLETACRLEPGEAEYRFKLGLAWNEVGRTDSTIAALQVAVRLDPMHGRAWYNLGLALNSIGKTHLALVALERAETASPGDPGAAYARATIFLGLGRLDEARQEAARALAIRPDFAPARSLLSSLR